MGLSSLPLGRITLQRYTPRAGVTLKAKPHTPGQGSPGRQEWREAALRQLSPSRPDGKLLLGCSLQSQSPLLPLLTGAHPPGLLSPFTAAPSRLLFQAWPG